jgi:hypothetical protein
MSAELRRERYYFGWLTGLPQKIGTRASEKGR